MPGKRRATSMYCSRSNCGNRCDGRQYCRCCKIAFYCGKECKKADSERHRKALVMQPTAEEDRADYRTCSVCGELTNEFCTFCKDSLVEWKTETKTGNVDEFWGRALCDCSQSCEGCEDTLEEMMSRLGVGESYCHNFPDCKNLVADDLGLSAECYECFANN